MDEAEQHTTRYYCIPPYRWEKLRFDLLTRQDQEWEPLPDTALARVRCLIRPAFQKLAPCDFYRIELNDPLIMEAAERTDLTSDFYHFLVYILTHEMVHLVRLSSILGDHPQETHFTESEESRVQRICYQILTGAPKFRPVLDRFYFNPAPRSYSDPSVDGFLANAWSSKIGNLRNVVATAR
jgi:hypothetical protein